MTRSLRTLRTVVIGAVLAASTACAHRTPIVALERGSTSMPDPGGCFLLIYDRPEFKGTREYLNGPVAYGQLTDLPFRANWRRRIRSVQVGPRASVALWAGERLRGRAEHLAPNATRPALARTFSGRIESLEIDCAG